MARRTLIIGLFVVLAQMATGCHHHKGQYREKHSLRHLQYQPCDCAGSSPIGTAPYFPAEQIPAPKKMPVTGMTTGLSVASPVR